MEIEKIVSTVQEKLGKTDVSAQTIQKAVEFRNSVAPLADGIEPDENYFMGIVNLAKDFQGNINYLLAGKAEEWKKNFNLNADNIKNFSAEQIADLKKWIEEKEGSKSNADEKYESLEKKYNELLNRLNNSDKAKEQSELLQKVKASMKEQKATDEYILDKTLEGVTLDVKKSIEDLTREMLTKYDSEYLKCHGSGIPPRQGTVGNQADSWLDKKFAAKANKEGWAKKD